ncbi:HTTM domain-containing protein [Geminocystis sp. NIES-3709]|uniref:HTTM domain-containing protein n=1 Tax=Geminocystis sp. NIES-3709 TaxID=1617448 RepID=UPI0005FC6365|nr:HTTM domain-containing protein [Geminocystis sp. NIES-3709]BAQ66671.1 hypothetical protein GM3709_3436 [Geminocystis sp. NIES-3709]
MDFLRLKSIIFTRLEKLFGFDLRSLALFRICLGILILIDLTVRFQDLKAHYTDFGVLPRDVLLTRHFNPWFWSIHLFSGQSLFQIALFLMTGICAIALILGYQTRLFTILSWFFLVSLQNRNPLINNSGDVLFRLLLFWSIFLPLGSYYSVDYALNLAKNKLSKKIFSGATIALTFQICLIYWCAWLFKSDPIWRVEGTAVYYALSLDLFATSFGKYLLNFPELLKFLNFATLSIELIGPFFLFMPIFTDSFRLATVIVFIGLHLGFRLALIIGIFYLVSCTGWLIFIPSFVWDKLSLKLRLSTSNYLKIYYDDRNILVKKILFIITTFLILPPEILNPLESDNQTKSWYIINEKNQKIYTNFRALIYLFTLSPLLFFIKPLFKLSIGKIIVKKLYNFPKKKISIFSSLIERVNFHSSTIRYSLINSFICLFLFVCIYYSNLTGFNFLNVNVPPFIQNLTLALRLDQKWSMFSPYPYLEDGWFVITAKLKNGAEIDLFNEGKSISWEKPKLVSATFKNQRWHKYLEILSSKTYSDDRLYYAQYLCRQWNSEHKGENQLDTFKIYYILEKTLPNYEKPSLQKIILWEHFCFKPPL